MADDLPTMLITGAAGGIGWATVELFYDAGWRVIGIDRCDPENPFPSSGLFIHADTVSYTHLRAHET